MSVKQMRAGIPQLFKGGTKHAVGLEATVRKNIEACVELSKITRTSLGPNGMNKMVINHLDKLFVTSDAATIMREMEIAHPAAKMIVMASDMQEQEVGDGSNFVVVFAGQLMHQAEGLLDMGLHPSEILNGYELAAKKVQELIQNLAVFTAEHKDMFNKDTLTKGIKTCIAAKQYGNENFLAPLVAEACLAVMPKNPANFLVDNVRVVKLLGGSVLQSELVRGMVVPHNTVGSISKLTDAKVAVFTCGVEPSSTETKGTVLLENAEELMSYNDTEEKNLQALIKSIRDTGVNCIVCSGTVTDMAKHFLDKYGIMCVKLSSQHDIRRMARAVKATPLVALQPPSQEEIGFCSSISTREMGLQNILVFSQASADATQIATIVLRGSTHNVLNDIERAVDDGVNIVRMMGRDGRFLAGGGANDIELARQLASYADARAGLEQYAVRAYAEALEVMPRILAENAGLVALDVVSQLYAEHEKGNTSHGVNIEDGGLRDATAENILDHLATKASGLRLASNAVVTILRVDQIIQSKPAGGPKAPSNQGHWDDD